MGALLTIDISLLLPIEPILPTRSVLALQVRISVSHLLSVLPLPPSPPTPPRFKTTGGGREGGSVSLQRNDGVADRIERMGQLFRGHGRIARRE